MGQSEWGERFLATTRGKIVGLLRGESRTVNDLAAAIGLTDNAVRAHLTTLERDGLVRQCGTRPGFRKPNLTYELTPEAGQLFPKPYAAALQQLLAVLRERLGPAEVEAVLREVGHRLAASLKGEVTSADVRDRVAEAVAVLGELGGMAQVEEADGGVMIRGYDCPLAAVVEQDPAGCRVAETLLSDLIGVPVTEHCQRDCPLRCAFHIPLKDRSGRS
jgi:predicted ArsR family transcriptional regulator